MQRYQTGGHRSPRISSPSTCISARTRTTDMRHMEMLWCKRKQRSAHYPEGQVLGRALVGGWLPSRRIPRVQPFSKPFLWNPSLSSGCWPNTGKKKDISLSRAEASSSFSRGSLLLPRIRDIFTISRKILLSSIEAFRNYLFWEIVVSNWILRE